MRILLFYTGHRQRNEIPPGGRFLEEAPPEISEADLIYHCNNPEISENTIRELLGGFRNPCKKVICTEKNTGFRFGHLEAIADSYDIICKGAYDWVIHLHADVYLTDGRKVLRILEEADRSSKEAVMFPLFENDANAFTTDFFAWKPGLIPKEVFSEYVDHVSNKDLIPEMFLYESLRKHGSENHIFYRYRGRGWQREIDDAGAWHPHDAKRVRTYLDRGVYIPWGWVKNLWLNIKRVIRGLFYSGIHDALL